jgi:hypothetical protein
MTRRRRIPTPTWWRRTGGAGRDELEYELLDTGVFAQDRYFDVFVEYAKASPEDILIHITACNRGAEEAELHTLPSDMKASSTARPPLGPRHRALTPRIHRGSWSGFDRD